MKSLLVLCLLCATAYSFPASSEEDSNDSELIHSMSRKGMPSVVEVDVGDSDEDSFFFPSFFRPFLFNPFPQFKFGGFPSFFSSTGSSGFGWKNLFSRVPDDDVTVTNSTSSVKVVDGHKVSVNVTTYKNEKSGAVYKYEIIEVTRLEKPEGEEEVEKSTEETIKNEPEATVTSKNESPEDTSSVKNDNNSLDNEIFREELADGNWEYYRGYPATTESRSENFEQLVQDYTDISDDIRVNTIAQQAAVNSPYFEVPADVELFDNNNPNDYLSKYQDYYVPARDIYDYTYNNPQLHQQIPSPNNGNNYKADYDRFGYQSYMNNYQYPYFNNIQYSDPRRRNYAPPPSPSKAPKYNYRRRSNDHY